MILNVFHKYEQASERWELYDQHFLQPLGAS